jgi:hypothetical protein
MVEVWDPDERPFGTRPNIDQNRAGLLDQDLPGLLR